MYLYFEDGALARRGCGQRLKKSRRGAGYSKLYSLP
jgi:hypothetical protein